MTVRIAEMIFIHMNRLLKWMLFSSKQLRNKYLLPIHLDLWWTWVNSGWIKDQNDIEDPNRTGNASYAGYLSTSAREALKPLKKPSKPLKKRKIVIPEQITDEAVGHSYSRYHLSERNTTSKRLHHRLQRLRMRTITPSLQRNLAVQLLSNDEIELSGVQFGLKSYAWYDIRPKLHDARFNYHFITSILKSPKYRTWSLQIFHWCSTEPVWN